MSATDPEARDLHLAYQNALRDIEAARGCAVKAVAERDEAIAERDAVIARYNCPDAEVCKTCPCAGDDDACFPGERLRAERDQLLEFQAAETARANTLELERDAAREALAMIASEVSWVKLGDVREYARSAFNNTRPLALTEGQET